MFAVYNMSGVSGILGGIVATILLTWLALRAQKTAGTACNKRVLAYGLPVRIVGWILLLICLFVVYAASRAAANQIVMAWCIGIAFLLMGLTLVLEFHFVRILFDDDFVYTFSP